MNARQLLILSLFLISIKAFASENETTDIVTLVGVTTVLKPDNTLMIKNQAIEEQKQLIVKLNSNQLPYNISEIRQFRTDNPARYSLLQLHGFYDDELIDQHSLDQELSSAVHNGNEEAVRTVLYKGGNPNANGVLSVALELEADKSIAPISRLLLVFGASVAPLVALHSDFFALEVLKKAPPTAWITHINDRNLAVVLDYYDPLNSRFNKVTTKVPFSDRDEKIFADMIFRHLTDKKTDRAMVAIEEITTSLGFGFQGDGMSPWCVCFGLSSNNHSELSPFCRTIRQPIPNTAIDFMCSNSAFQSSLDQNNEKQQVDE